MATTPYKVSKPKFDIRYRIQISSSGKNSSANKMTTLLPIVYKHIILIFYLNEAYACVSLIIYVIIRKIM